MTWHVEIYSVAPYKAARHTDLTTEQAVQQISHALAQGNIGGVVVYRPPVPTQNGAVGNKTEEGEMDLERGNKSTAAVQDPVAWLNRHDHDPEFHATIKSLLHPAGGGAPRRAEAVLMLEQYIAWTTPIRARVFGWGNEWNTAITELSNYRSLPQIRTVQHLLKATTSTMGKPE